MLEEIERPSIILLLELADAVARERLHEARDVEGRPTTRLKRSTAGSRLPRETEPVVEHYLATGKLVKMHAERPIEEVWAEISDALEQVGAPA